MNILIIGCGYTGFRLAGLHRKHGDRVTVTSRSAARDSALRQSGFESLQLDLDDPGRSSLLEADLIYLLAPPSGNGAHDPRSARLIKLIDATPPRRFVYMSTTGVYGDCDGDWVDESRPRNPQTPRASCRAAAEQQLELWASQRRVELIIMRVAGIYGPDRLPVARVERGDPVVRDSEAPWSNRIHVDDLTMAAWRAGTYASADGIYNVSDGRPTTMSDYFTRVARHLGLPPPPQVSRAEAEQTFNAGLLSFLNESRRIDNHRLIDELGLGLRYPNLDAGLKACTDKNSIG